MRLETERQKAATNLSQYDAFCRWQFAASCRLLPPAVMHTAVAPEGTGSKSVRHLPLAQFEAMTAEVNVARNLRNCCVTSSTQLNIIQRGSTSAVDALAKGVENRRRVRPRLATRNQFWTAHALPLILTRFLRLAKISPHIARNASFVLTAR